MATIFKTHFDKYLILPFDVDFNDIKNDKLIIKTEVNCSERFILVDDISNFIDSSNVVNKKIGKIYETSDYEQDVPFKSSTTNGYKLYYTNIIATNIKVYCCFNKSRSYVSHEPIPEVTLEPKNSVLRNVLSYDFDDIFGYKKPYKKATIFFNKYMFKSSNHFERLLFPYPNKKTSYSLDFDSLRYATDEIKEKHSKWLEKQEVIRVKRIEYERRLNEQKSKPYFCDTCGIPTENYIPNPFHVEINNDYTKEWLCDDCYNNCLGDI